MKPIGRSFRTVAAAPLACLLLFSSALAADWPQLQNGPQRLGYSAEAIEPPLKNAWAVGLSPERLHPQAQPVISGGRLFIGTAMGNLHAFDARTGQRRWQFAAGGPILHTAGVEGGRVFFGCLDGCVYALDAADGKLAWKFDSGLRTGFSTAVLLAEGNVFIANRGGTYYALSQKDGAVVWKQDLGVPLLMSSAFDAGKLFFGAMDLRVYALDSKTGRIAWKSEPLPGAAFKDYWPVALKGYVLVRPARVSGGPTGPAIEWLHGPLPESELAKQEAMIQALEKNPASRNLFVLDAATGREAMLLPHWVTCTMNGATTPPCVDGDGLLVIPVTLHDWRGGWGRLDLAKRRVVEVLCEDQADAQGRRRGMGNSDECLNVSAAGRSVLVFHTQEGNANFTGVWHLDRREWKQVAPYHVDGFFSSNTQGGGGNPPAVADGMIFHTSNNTLNGRSAMTAGKEGAP
ncbi:MAG: PQQ-binding-like beta-propeller repeat protein [Planctomycetota bacterium]|nr:PQQ-binding-like beta-propeller repeat protein [Planctomycetota bacterium]